MERRRYKRYKRKIEKKKIVLKILRSKNFWFSLLSLVTVFTIFYLIFFSSFAQLKSISCYAKNQELKREVHDFIAKNTEKNFFFLKANSIFFIDQDLIKKKVKEKFPEIEKIILKKDFLERSLIVRIEEKEPVAVFCQEDKCFFIDKKGIIFQEFILESKKENEERSEERKENGIRLGKKKMIIRLGYILPNLVLDREIIDPEMMEKILKIKKEMIILNLFPKEVLLVSEKRLNIKTNEDWEVYFDPSKDIDWQLTELKTIIEKYIPLEKRKNLKYIDLRFRKVYIFPSFH